MASNDNDAEQAIFKDVWFSAVQPLRIANEVRYSTLLHARLNMFLFEIISSH